MSDEKLSRIFGLLANVLATMSSIVASKNLDDNARATLAKSALEASALARAACEYLDAN